MTFDSILNWLMDHPLIFLPIVLILAYLLYRLTKYVLARGLFKVAISTETIYDDLIVDRLRPFRAAWLVPLGLLFAYSYFAIAPDAAITDVLLFLIIAVVADFLVSLLGGLNQVYKHRPTYTGVSVAAYFNLLQVLVVVGAIFLAIVLFADVAPAVLLGGLGAWLAVLLLIFRDTILNFLASIQLSSQALVKDGDWIDVPSFGADGIVTDVSLNTIKVQNWDKTISAVPTYKLIEVPFKNYRAMEESGGRRIVLTFTFDIKSIEFCSMAVLEKMSKYDLIDDVVRDQIDRLKESELDSAGPVDFPLDGPQITNIDLFMEYAKAYLRSRKDMRQRRFLFLLRVVEPTREGLPLQIIVFTKNIPLVEFSATQSAILMHLVAAAPHFGLRIFQEPTGEDLRASSE